MYVRLNEWINKQINKRKIPLEEAKKAQTRSRGTALLFL